MPSVGVQASAAILSLARDLRTALDQRCAPLGLTSQQAGLLIYVFTGLNTGKQLAEALGTDSAGITRLLDRLEAKGYVQRSPDPTDRRVQAISLTRVGRALIPDLPGLFEDVAATMLRDVDAGRAYAKAYVEFVHYAERLYGAAETLAPVHAHPQSIH